MSELTVTWMPYPTDEQFDMAAPLLQKVVDVGRGEYTVEDLRGMAKAGAVLIGVAFRDGDPVMAAALQFVHYPRYTTLNIMALGGAGLADVSQKFFDEVKEFARSNGAKHIEASCRRSMARLLRVFHGFNPVYERMRVAL